MEKIEEKLIVLIKENPMLYAKGSKDYKNTDKKEKAWTLIAVELNLKVDAVKKRWRSLRDRFVREARQLKEQSRSGAGEDSCASSWPFFEEMKFLQSHTEPRPTSSNYQDKSVSEEEPEQDIEHIHSGSESSFNKTTSLTTPTAGSSRRRKHALDTDEHFQGILEKVEQHVEGWSAKKSRHESFCKYIADRMEMLPEQVARSLEVEFILRVNQSIDEFNNLIETDDAF